MHYRLNNLFVLCFLGGLYRRKEVWVKNTVALIAGVAVAFCAWGQPQAPVRVLFVPYETPTSFYLWDPEEAQALGYAFKIVEPPRSGRLLGELPALTYVPNPKFYGTDRLQYLVEDPLGRFDIGVIQIVVLPVVTLLERPVVPPNVSLVGTLDFSGMPVEVKLSRWEVGYFQKLAFLEQELRASWGPTGFSSLSSRTRLDLVIPGDPALQIPVISTLSFDPNLPGLASASVQSWANLWGIFAFALVNYLGTDPSTSTALLTLRTSLGNLSVEGRSTWKIIPLEFSELAVRLAGPGAALGCPACTFRFEGSATFAKDEGLKELRLSLLEPSSSRPGRRRGTGRRPAPGRARRRAAWWMRANPLTPCHAAWENSASMPRCPSTAGSASMFSCRKTNEANSPSATRTSTATPSSHSINRRSTS